MESLVAIIIFLVVLAVVSHYVLRKKPPIINETRIRAHLDKNIPPKFIQILGLVGRVMLVRINENLYSYFWLPTGRESPPIHKELERIADKINQFLPGGLTYEYKHIMLSTMSDTIPSGGILCRIKIPSPEYAEEIVLRVAYAIQELLKQKERLTETDVLSTKIYPLVVLTEHKPIRKKISVRPESLIAELKEKEKRKKILGPFPGRGFPPIFPGGESEGPPFIREETETPPPAIFPHPLLDKKLLRKEEEQEEQEEEKGGE